MTPIDALGARQQIGHVSFISTGLNAAASIIAEQAALGTHAVHVHLLNAYSVALAERDPLYRQCVSGESVNLPDGKPLTWVSRARKDSPSLSQIRGADLFAAVFKVSEETGLRHFLLGSQPETLRRLKRALEFQYPDAQIVGAFSPPFRPMSASEIRAQDELLTSSRAQVVWVGLGTPKQDFEGARIAAELGLTTIAVGAAFDFAAGTAKEAPRIFTKIGLEWLYRLCSEPRRLWRRYTIWNARFAKVAIAAIRRGG